MRNSEHCKWDETATSTLVITFTVNIWHIESKQNHTNDKNYWRVFFTYTVILELTKEKPKQVKQKAVKSNCSSTFLEFAISRMWLNSSQSMQMRMTAKNFALNELRGNLIVLRIKFDTLKTFLRTRMSRRLYSLAGSYIFRSCLIM